MRRRPAVRLSKVSRRCLTDSKQLEAFTDHFKYRWGQFQKTLEVGRLRLQLPGQPRRLPVRSHPGTRFGACSCGTARVLSLSFFLHSSLLSRALARWRTFRGATSTLDSLARSVSRPSKTHNRVSDRQESRARQERRSGLGRRGGPAGNTHDPKRRQCRVPGALHGPSVCVPACAHTQMHTRTLPSRPAPLSIESGRQRPRPWRSLATSGGRPYSCRTATVQLPYISCRTTHHSGAAPRRCLPLTAFVAAAAASPAAAEAAGGHEAPQSPRRAATWALVSLSRVLLRRLRRCPLAPAATGSPSG